MGLQYAANSGSAPERLACVCVGPVWVPYGALPSGSDRLITSDALLYIPRFGQPCGPTLAMVPLVPPSLA